MAWSKESNKKYYEANKEKIKANQRKYKKENRDKIKDSNLRYRYKITLDDWKQKFEVQEGKCKICNLEKELVVDHKHETDKIRDLLCHDCNKGVGLFYEKPELLREAASYLERHK